MIPMQPEYLIKPTSDLSQWQQYRCLPVADAVTLAFCHAFSEVLLSQRQHSELTALGFWLREANLAQQLKRHLPAGQLSALGHVLHITPNNVDSMFAYSWCCSLLMGNCNLVRVSQSSNPVKTALLQVIEGLFQRPEFSAIADRNLFVEYPKDSPLSAQLSCLADARVIWGGDDSVRAIRALPAKPATRDIAFGNRWSACLIDGDSLVADSLPVLAERLWRDVYPHAQQACSSPQVVFWTGAKTMQADLFAVIDQLAETQPRQLTAANEHLLASQWLLANQQAEQIFRQRVTAIRVTQAQTGLCADGFFQIVNLSEKAQLRQYIDEGLQTLSYFGPCPDPQWISSLAKIDRLVPVGQALAFSAVWDGYNLFSELTRQVTYE